MRETIKREKGITLVALVITIIIIIILATVTLNFAFGDNGLIKRAEDARDYYTKAMHGSYSIKYVLPALFPDDKDLDYHALPVVHNGGEAMSVFATLGEQTKEEQERIRYGLLEYCTLDTLAMVKIWEKLKKVI